MKAFRRSVVAVCAALLATAGALVISASPAHAVESYVTCPATQSGFVVGAGAGGISGTDSGRLTSQEVFDIYNSKCNYRARYWYEPYGFPRVYSGYCTWSRDYNFITGLGSRYGLWCRT